MTKDYVSRAGNKLEFALTNFSLDIKDNICADFGSSTGGFVDCLLKFGAEKVYSVDTAYGELDWKLRNDPKVIILERTNAMYVNLPEKIDLITIDTSWTRQINILPNALKNLKENGKIISLIKPQYETTGNNFDSNNVLEAVLLQIRHLGAFVKDVKQSPVLGGRKKNIEYICVLTKNDRGV